MSKEKELEAALKSLAESASNYVKDDVWFVALMIDLRNAGFVLNDSELHDWADECLGEND
jgi:hypothetical protein